MEALIVLAFCMTALEHADADLYSGVRERYFSPRAGDVWEFAVADGSGIDLRVAGRGGIGNMREQRTVRADAC